MKQKDKEVYEVKKKKYNFNDEVNRLFEELVEKKNKGLKDLELIRNSITVKIDSQINELYKKKDFITEIFINRAELRKHKVSFWSKLIHGNLSMIVRGIISMPFIYGMLIPTIVMHIFVEMYHQICFRLYKIPRVNPKDYFHFDRRHLPYLNWFEKLNCFYCSYFNAFTAYAKEIGGRTERFWCPIKHSMKLESPHSEYSNFVDYSDGESLRKRWAELRDFSAPIENGCQSREFDSEVEQDKEVSKKTKKKVSNKKVSKKTGKSVKKKAVKKVDKNTKNK